MISNKNSRLFIISFLVVLTSLYVFSYFPAIMDGFNNFIVRCADFGQYLSEAQKYSRDGQFLIDIASVGEEPGLFLIVSSLERIAWIIPNIGLIMLPLLLQILLVMAMYIGVRNTTNKKTVGILIVILTCTAYLTNTSLTYLVSRQILANCFLLITFVFLEHEKIKNKSQIFTCGVLLAGSYLWHRIGLMFWVIILSSCFLYALIMKNKFWIKKYFLCLLISFLLCFPYLFLQFWDIIYSLQWYTNRVPSEWLADWAKGYIPGWSFFTYRGDTTELPLFHYFKNQPWMILLAAWWLKWIIRLIKKNITMGLAFLITTSYISLKLIFWVRILATFEIFLLFFIGYTYFFQFRQKKWLLIITVFTCAILGLINLVPKSIKASRITNIQNDSSILFIKNNIPKKKSFLMWEYCVADIASQLGYTGANNLVSAPIWKHKERELNWEIQYYTAVSLSDILVSSVWVKPYLHNVFKNLDIYLMFRNSMSKKADIDKLLLGTHSYFNSPYLEIIYVDRSKRSQILYMFHLKNNQITYFDTPNYAQKNLMELNEFYE